MLLKWLIKLTLADSHNSIITKHGTVSHGTEIRSSDTVTDEKTIIPVSKKHPPVTIENDIRPISLTPIIAKVFESLVLKWVVYYVKPQIDDKQYGGMAGTCTTDALVEMRHK